MDQATFQDVTWLLHDLGRCLKSIMPSTPESCDTRGLLWVVVRDQQPRLTGGRNPFNWLKELQATSNFWAHLQPGSDVPEDDVWRDLDTLERVAKYLGLDPEFVDNVHEVKERIRAGKSPEHTQPSEIEIRSWIREEVAQQLAIHPQAGPSQPPTGELVGAQGGGAQPERYRGEHADRVRDHVSSVYIKPAREEGLKQVRVRAGDVDKALGYQYRRLPLVCAALRSKKFLNAARVKLLGETGPPSGASTSTTFSYELESASDD